ncbi:MAG: sensor histidine kinase [Actinomycetota bacterium]
MSGHTGSAQQVQQEQHAADELRELRLLRSTINLLQAGDLGVGMADFVAELSDELCLDDVTIESRSERQEVTPAGGSAASPATAGDGSPGAGPTPLPIAPGERFELPLMCGTNVVGTLGARARDGLSPAARLSLERACEMLAVAIDRARILHDEQRTVAGLRELAEMKAAFLGSVTHELRTTVTIIEGFAMLLSRQAEHLDEHQRADFIDRIWHSSRSLGTLVEDLLDLARIEGSGLKVVLQPVDLSSLVPKIVGQMSTVLGHHRVVMSIAPNVAAVSDPGAIERVLINLVSNAAKYTPPATTVGVGLRADAHHAVLTVEDEGPGIPLHERTRVFDRFYRIDNGGEAMVRGMGIGLALVRDLVTLNGGNVTIDDAPGGGARVTVEIPLAD